jgi:hypothetical protein
VKKLMYILILMQAAAFVYPDFIVLKNGTQLNGEIVKRENGVAVIETIERILSIREDQIEKVVEGVSLVELYHQKKKKAVTAHDHLELAAWCFKNRFDRAGRAESALAKKLAPEFIIPEAPEKQEKKAGKTEEEKELTRKTIAVKRTVSSLRRSWYSESAEKYKKKLEAYPLSVKSPVFIRQLDYTETKYWKFRDYIIDELLEDPDVEDSVYIEHILKEPVKRVRKKAVKHFLADPQKKKVLEDAMLNAFVSKKHDFDMHMNAADTLGMIRSWRSVPVLLKSFRIIWGGGARSHYFIGTVHPYVRDVTPVVATGATSFDPEIDTYTTGCVLDVKVKSIERIIISRTLQDITGYYLSNPNDWVQWWAGKGHREYAQHLGLTPGSEVRGQKTEDSRRRAAGRYGAPKAGSQKEVAPIKGDGAGGEKKRVTSNQ